MAAVVPVQVNYQEVFSFRFGDFMFCNRPPVLREEPVLWIWIRMFLGLLDTDLLVKGMEPDPDSSIIKQKYIKNLIPTVL